MKNKYPESYVYVGSISRKVYVLICNLFLSEKFLNNMGLPINNHFCPTLQYA